MMMRSFHVISGNAAFSPSAEAQADALGVPRHAEVRRRVVMSLIDAERTLRLEAAGWETTVAMVGLDLLGFPSVLCDRVRARVPRIPAKNILIGSTHSHSAPDCYAFPDGRGGHCGRGTGESFAANIGGRVLGTAAAWFTLTFSASDKPDPARVAIVGACVAGVYALVGAIVTQFLPEPKPRLGTGSSCVCSVGPKVMAPYQVVPNQRP